MSMRCTCHVTTRAATATRQLQATRPRRRCHARHAYQVAAGLGVGAQVQRRVLEVVHEEVRRLLMLGPGTPRRVLVLGPQLAKLQRRHEQALRAPVGLVVVLQHWVAGVATRMARGGLVCSTHGHVSATVRQRRNAAFTYVIGAQCAGAVVHRSVACSEAARLVDVAVHAVVRKLGAGA